jgi:DNA-binding FrmR family transcriptional regulator
MLGSSVAEALSNVRRIAEAAHVTVARTVLEEGQDVDDVARRLAAAARELDALQTRVLESTLRYQAVVPCLMPDVPSHSETGWGEGGGGRGGGWFSVAVARLRRPL